MSQKSKKKASTKKKVSVKKNIAKKPSKKKGKGKVIIKEKIERKRSIVKKPKKPESSVKASSEIPPKNPKVAGWKGRIKKNAEEDHLLSIERKPKALITYESTWSPVATQQQQSIILKRGFFILIFADRKAGKTRFGVKCNEFEGFKGKTRIVPPGSPTWILDSETDAVATEALKEFQDQMKSGELLIHNYGKRIEGTKRRDNKATMEELETFVLALRDQHQGTLVIDTFTEYCAAAEDRLVEVVGKGFDDNNVPIKKVAPVQWKWRTKEIVDMLQTLRTYGINIVLIAQGKDAYEKVDPKKPFDVNKTGELLADVLKKVNYWVDIICLMEKFDDEDSFIERRLSVLHSRWEDDRTNRDDLVLMNENISLSNLIELFEDKL